MKSAPSGAEIEKRVWIHAALASHILRIVSLSSDEQMRRIDARRIVAAMQDVQFARIAKRESVGKPMGFPFSPLVLDYAVAAAIA